MASLTAIRLNTRRGLFAHAPAALAIPWPRLPCTATRLFGISSAVLPHWPRQGLVALASTRASLGPCRPRSSMDLVVVSSTVLCSDPRRGVLARALVTRHPVPCRGLVDCAPPRSLLWASNMTPDGDALIMSRITARWRGMPNASSHRNAVISSGWRCAMGSGTSHQGRRPLCQGGQPTGGGGRRI